MIHIEKIEIVKDYRTFKKGLEIELRSLNLLVGDQGAGKSSLLQCLHELGQQNKGEKVVQIVLKKDSQQKGVEVFYFDAEKHNPRMKDPQLYTDVRGRDVGIGYTNALVSRFASHGEILKKFTVDAISKASKCIVLLDEPESALSLKNQFKLVKEIQKAVDRNVQVLMATHCLPLIQSVENVYSVEHFKWMTSKEFIELSAS